MRLIGYCEQCQRITRVKPRNSFLASGMVRGICSECEEKERKAREERR